MERGTYPGIGDNAQQAARHICTDTRAARARRMRFAARRSAMPTPNHPPPATRRAVDESHQQSDDAVAHTLLRLPATRADERYHLREGPVPEAAGPEHC